MVLDLAKRAGRSGKPLSLTVLRTNRARALYLRLGFVETKRDENKIYMALTGGTA